MRSLVQIIILSLLVFGTAAGQQNQSAEVRLLNNLFAGTRQDVRPVLNISKPTVVTIEMVYTQILKLDSKNQILTSQVWMRMFWETPYIVWDLREYGGLEMISLKPTKLWIPDITVYNVISDKQEKSLFNALDTNINVRYDGQIKWLAPAVVKTNCKIAVDYFPFDSQACSIKIGSWSHDTRYIDLRFKNSTNDVSRNYNKNSEWSLISVQKQRKLEQFSCCLAPFSILTYTVKAHRRASYYVTNFILPCGVIAVLCLMSFCLPPDSGERVSLVITILLAMAVYMTMMADQMPPNSEVVPIISVFFITVMVHVAFVLVVTCAIIQFQFNKGPVPAHVGCFINEKLAKLVGLKKRVGKVKPSQKLKISSNAHTLGSERVHLKEIGDFSGNGKTSIEAVNDLSSNIVTLDKQDRLDNRHEKENDIKHNVDEWHFAACVLNRMFFVFFFCSSFISTLIIFFSAPRFSPNFEEEEM